MSQIAIIPARGGSKRLPGKNILEVFGRPMLSYPVAAALESRLFDQVIVSTEDAQIKSAAIDAGARVMDRPKTLARDRSTVVDVCRHVIESLQKEGTDPSWFCCIYATALFITHEDLRQSAMLREKFPLADVIMGVSGFNLQPVQALDTGAGGYLTTKWPEYHGIQSQFHPRLVASNGTLYWARTRVFIEQNTFYAKKLKGYEIPWIRAIDLDTPQDLETARLIAPLLLKG